MLRVAFQIDPPLKEKLAKFGKADFCVSSIVAIAEKEIVKEHKFFPATTGLIPDLKTLRDYLASSKLPCAYIFIRIKPNQPSLVVYMTDEAKAKDRMIYSTGTSTMQDVVHVSASYIVQASSPNDICPELFIRRESGAGREALMTESERQQAEIAKMEVAPQPSRLPGVSIPVAPELDAALEKFAKGTLTVITIKIEEGKIELDKTIEKEQGLDKIVPILPTDHPRYIITRFTPKACKEEKTVLIYVCPQSCPPKEKMPYASSKAPFIQHVEGKNIKFDRRVETEVSEMIQTTEDHFVELQEEDESKAKAPPKTISGKGPKMLI